MPILTEEERVGTLVAGRYRLTTLLGRGGTGVVYAAEHTWTGRRVAVKVLRPEYARDLTLTRRFLQEARAAATIEHPNVVGVFDMGSDDDGTVFMALEHVDGEPLSSILAREGNLGPSRALTILLPVMDALQAAHEAGVIHRDLKPENVLVRTDPDPDGPPHPKLVDFGMARMVTSSWGRATQTGIAVGTPLYMSPEQAHADEAIGPASDVWAMGVLLFHVLSGRFPHESESPAQLLISIVSGDTRHLGDVAPEVPEPLQRAIMTALTRDLSIRYPSMAAFRDALLDAAAESGVAFELPRPSRVDPTQPTAHPKPTAPSSRVTPVPAEITGARPPWLPGRRSWTLAAVSLGTGALVAVGLAIRPSAVPDDTGSPAGGVTSADHTMSPPPPVPATETVAAPPREMARPAALEDDGDDAAPHPADAPTDPTASEDGPSEHPERAAKPHRRSPRRDDRAGVADDDPPSAARRPPHRRAGSGAAHRSVPEAPGGAPTARPGPDAPGDPAPQRSGRVVDIARQF